MIKLADFTLHAKPWGVHEFSWGTAVRHEPTGQWHKIFIGFGDNTQEIDISKMDVILHDNGIEFVE